MTLAEQNAETVRRGYAAFNSADMKTLTALFDENGSWHTPGRSRIASGREHFVDLYAWDEFWS